MIADRPDHAGRRCATGSGIAAPRLAVCAVNPHAGESGLFGDEEERVLRPAAEALGAAGPLPADTVFVRAMRGEFDAVLAPYHDVGMTAIKVAAFGRAVNVTLGLPFPRTSPDHGTALDIAGTGKADASSMRAAIELAVKLAGEERNGQGRADRELQLATRGCPRFALAAYRPVSSRSIRSEIRVELELLRRPVGHQHRAALQDRLPLDQAVRPQRVAGIHQVHDPVRQVEQRRDLDRAVHLDDVHRPARGAEVRLREARVLGGDPGGDAARQRGIGRVRRARPPPAGRSRSPAPAARARRRRSRAARRCR